MLPLLCSFLRSYALRFQIPLRRAGVHVHVELEGRCMGQSAISKQHSLFASYTLSQLPTGYRPVLLSASRLLVDCERWQGAAAT